jgi:hypothetical protein
MRAPHAGWQPEPDEGDSQLCIPAQGEGNIQLLQLPVHESATKSTPGMVDTQLGRYSMPAALWPLTKPVRWLLFRSPAEGALAAVAAGLVDGADRAVGQYMDAEVVLETLPETRADQAGLAAALVAWANQACKL